MAADIARAGGPSAPVADPLRRSRGAPRPTGRLPRSSSWALRRATSMPATRAAGASAAEPRTAPWSWPAWASGWASCSAWTRRPRTRTSSTSSRDAGAEIRARAPAQRPRLPAPYERPPARTRALRGTGRPAAGRGAPAGLARSARPGTSRRSPTSSPTAGPRSRRVRSSPLGWQGLLRDLERGAPVRPRAAPARGPLLRRADLVSVSVEDLDPAVELRGAAATPAHGGDLHADARSARRARVDRPLRHPAHAAFPRAADRSRGRHDGRRRCVPGGVPGGPDCARARRPAATPPAPPSGSRPRWPRSHVAGSRSRAACRHWPRSGDALRRPPPG